MTLIGPTSAPSLSDQASSAGWEFGFYDFFDASPENEYFNPALVRWQEKDYLIVRRRTGPLGKPGRNVLEAWQLVGNIPLKRQPLPIQASHPDESFEDPRAFVRGENLIVSFCTFVPGEGFAHQSMTGIRPGWLIEPPISIAIGKNGPTRAENKGHEKNWTPFLHEGALHISYDLSNGQHVVVQTGGGRAKKVEYGRAPTWPWGTLRGGTCPTLHNGLFWTFFHSSNAWYAGKRRYYMGALAFEPQPPFNVVRMARKPLLIASEKDFRNIHAPPCVWPGGAIKCDTSWRVSLGVNDCRCGFLNISHEEVEKLCYVTC